MEQQQTHPRTREEVNIDHRNGSDDQGNTTGIHTARATLDEGILNVTYNELNGVGEATITLDRDKDGRVDATFTSNRQRGSYFTSGDRPVMNYSATDAQRLTDQVRNIVVNGGANLGMYHQVVDFVNDPTSNPLPTVRGQNQR